MTDDAAVNIQGVSVRFGKGAPALDGVSVQVGKGKITGLIGPSGAGKTTLMRSIVGRQHVDDGRITVYGQPAGSSGLRDVVSYKTQEVSAYNDLTVAQNLRYFAAMMNVPRKQVKAEVDRLIGLTGLSAQAKQLAGSLSGGQKQRVSLAIALLGEPKLFVLDEPTVGLDPILRNELWGLFRQLTEQGATLLISSHVMDEASRCDDLILIRQGKIIAHQTPDMMRRETGSKTIEASFIKLIEDKS